MKYYVNDDWITREEQVEGKSQEVLKTIKELIEKNPNFPPSVAETLQQHVNV